MFLQDCQKVVVRVALMEKNGLAVLGRQIELACEGGTLALWWRQVAKIIQAALAARHRQMIIEHPVQPLPGPLGRIRPLSSHMRMNSGGTPQCPRVLLS